MAGIVLSILWVPELSCESVNAVVASGGLGNLNFKGDNNILKYRVLWCILRMYGNNMYRKLQLDIPVTSFYNARISSHIHLTCCSPATYIAIQHVARPLVLLQLHFRLPAAAASHDTALVLARVLAGASAL
jgi:hypothetical protein